MTSTNSSPRSRMPTRQGNGYRRNTETTNLGLSWVLTASKVTQGIFTDANRQASTLQKSQFHEEAIVINCGHGSLVLTPEMAAELCLVLGYYGYSHNLPEPTAMIELDEDEE